MWLIVLAMVVLAVAIAFLINAVYRRRRLDLEWDHMSDNQLLVETVKGFTWMYAVGSGVVIAVVVIEIFL